MKKIFVILLSIAIPSILFAQQKTGNLTVFSEDGDKFYLFLNGEKQNDIPQTNIRVEELPQPYYRAKIIFEDQTLGEISKTLPVADADDVMMDVTYRLRKDKNRKVKLNPYSSTEVVPEFVIPAGMYVRKFGQPQNNQVGYQTTTTTSANTMNASVSVPGVNMNISINDPNMVVTSTTTTTTSSSSTGGIKTPPPSNNNCSGWPMKQNDFDVAKRTINESSFDETKLSTAKSIASSNCLSSDQVTEICKLFSFEQSKLDFAKYAYKYTTDQKNYFKVNSVFSFSASKEELNKFVAGD